MSWVTDAGQLLAAAGVGSILGSLLTQFVSRSGERRALRAKVREELSIVEELRWAVKADEPETERRSADLLSARRRLLSAAMLARLPRDLVEEYDRLAVVALESSKEILAAQQRASVPGPVSECVDAAFELICDLLWHPHVARLTYRRRFKKLQELVNENKEKDGGHNLRFKAVKP